MPTLTVGSDPEVVLMNRQGQPISAPNVLKYGPGEIEIRHNKTRFGNFYPDNANLEFSPNHGETKEEFVGNIRGLLTIAHNVIGPEYTMHAIPSLEFPVKELEHPICAKFGCDPSYDSFEVKVNTVPKGAVKRQLRSAGGHIHLGNGGGHDYLQDFKSQLETVNTFELIAGIPSLLLDNTKEAMQRRVLYGKAGDHRLKPYGVECRSLSNFWIAAPELTGYVYDLAQITGKEMLEQNMKSFDKYKLPNVINKGNLQTAKEIYKEVVQTYPEIHAGFEAVEMLVNMDKKIPLHEKWQISREE